MRFPVTSLHGIFWHSFERTRRPSPAIGNLGLGFLTAVRMHRQSLGKCRGSSQVRKAVNVSGIRRRCRRKTPTDGMEQTLGSNGAEAESPPVEVRWTEVVCGGSNCDIHFSRRWSGVWNGVCAQAAGVA